jgi:hypothetical protein
MTVRVLRTSPTKRPPSKLHSTERRGSDVADNRKPVRLSNNERSVAIACGWVVKGYQKERVEFRGEDLVVSAAQPATSLEVLLWDMAVKGEAGWTAAIVGSDAGA